MADELNKLYDCSRGQGFGGEVRFHKLIFLRYFFILL